MRYTTYINNSRCLEWGINPSQGALVDLFNQLPSWAKAETVDGKTFYHIARQKILEELPVWFKTADNVYRNIKHLAELGIIEHIKIDRRDLVRLSETGNKWNSEKIPTLGEFSEKEPINSEKNPTYNTTNNNTTKKKLKKKFSITNFEDYINLFEEHMELRKQLLPSFSEFHKEQLLLSLNASNNSYGVLLDVLYGKNDLGQPLKNVLSISGQITFEQFQSLMEFRKANPFSFSDILQRMENYKDASKKYTSLYLTIRNWAKKK